MGGGGWRRIGMLGMEDEGFSIEEEGVGDSVRIWWGLLCCFHLSQIYNRIKLISFVAG